MTESMIEHVARAICEARGLDPDGVPELAPSSDALAVRPDVAKSSWRWFIPAARAAIKTIRDALPHGISRTILDEALEG